MEKPPGALAGAAAAAAGSPLASPQRSIGRLGVAQIG